MQRGHGNNFHRDQQSLRDRVTAISGPRSDLRDTNEFMWETGLRPLPRDYQTFWFWSTEARPGDPSNPYTVLETVFNTANASLLLRHRRDNIWVFHPELAGIFSASRGFPFRVGFGKIGPVLVYRVERHVFKNGVAPIEKNVVYRVIVSKNASLRAPNTDGGHGRNGGNGGRQNSGSRRGYRGRSTQPLHEVLEEARGLIRRARPYFERPVQNDAGEYVDHNDDPVPVDNAAFEAEADLLAGDEDLNDVDMMDANPDPELGQLLAEAQDRAQNQQQAESLNRDADEGSAGAPGIDAQADFLLEDVGSGADAASQAERDMSNR